MKKMGKRCLSLALCLLLCLALIPAASADSGWRENESGVWYQFSDGTWPADGWLMIDNDWYRFDASGYRQSGWVYSGGSWYYLYADGRMATGWILYGDTWYYLNSSGAMATGWLWDNGYWYYLNGDGSMATGWINDGSAWYYLYPSGAMATGWLNYYGSNYYLRSDGSMITGQARDAGGLRYFFPDGHMATDEYVVLSDKLCYYNKEGYRDTPPEKGGDVGVTITLTGGDAVEVPVALRFEEPGYQAQDSRGNDLTEFVKVTGTVVPTELGTYVLCYTLATDWGKDISVNRTVKVVPAEKPETWMPKEKTIYLTFDDGPSVYTSELLDVLAKYNVKATFFVTGNGSRYNKMIGRAYREGHSIGVHSYTHNYSEVYASEQAFLDDFCAVEDLIYEQTGTYTRLFRFPGGSSNTVSNFNPGIMTRLVKLMTNMGYVYFDWNVTSGDAGETTETENVYGNVINGCSGKTASVVLQHDIKGFSVDAVENIIQWGLANGYHFAALDEHSYTAHHGINN